MSDPERYASPMALERAIGDRIRTRVTQEADERQLPPGRERAAFESRRIAQLRRDVAMQRAVVRLIRHAPERWVVKGGIALQLRLDPSRPSLDIDIVDRADPMDRDLQVRDLTAAFAQRLDDRFEFEVGRPTFNGEDRSTTIPVTALLGRKEFARFEVDIAPSGSHADAEQMTMSLPIDVELGDAEVEVAVMRVEPQVADKVCAMFELHGAARDVPSHRWRDLADVAMLAQQVDGIEAADLLAAVTAEAARRTDTLPEGLPSTFRLPDRQLASWRRIWGDRGRAVPIDVDVALEAATTFLGPVLAGSARGTWLPDAQRWSD